jgi:hypothetical protein
MSYMHEENRRIEKDIIYFKKYRQNLKTFAFGLITGKPFMRIKYYSLLEEVDRVTIKIEALRVIKSGFETYKEF